MLFCKDCKKVALFTSPVGCNHYVFEGVDKVTGEEFRTRFLAHDMREDCELEYANDLWNPCGTAARFFEKNDNH